MPTDMQAPGMQASTLETFDTRSGSVLETLLFNNRRAILVLTVILTCTLGWSALKLKVGASFIALLPSHHAFVANYEDNRGTMRALGNSVRIIVSNKKGTIYDPHYLAVLRDISDTAFLLPDVDRSFMKSLWTPVVSWQEINEKGITTGPVMPNKYDGSTESIERLQQNVLKAGIIGSIVANDQRSSEVFVPLLDRDAATGLAFDYGSFWQLLQQKVLSKQSDTIGIHVVGFAAVMGNLIAALYEILGFFVVAALLAGMFIFGFTRCVSSTLLIMACSLIAVIWLLGLIRLLGYSLDPYSILVPFLIFAIGVSHGAQKMNGIMQDIGRGMHRYVAARMTFRRLFVAGLTALMADAVGFAVLYVIDIPAIKVLAVTASIGVVLLVFTNLVLLPVLLSYVGVSQKAALRSRRLDQITDSSMFAAVFRVLERFCSRRWAIGAICGAAVLVIVGLVVGAGLQIGDVNPGAPELRPNSIYNRDNSYVTTHYGLSTDEFAVIVKTGPNGLNNYQSILEMDRLGQYLADVPGVQTTSSAAKFVRIYTAGEFEGNLKWWNINRGRYVIGPALDGVLTGNPELINTEFSSAPVIAYLRDHKASTLTAVSQAAERFANAHSTQDEHFLLAAGSAGMAAATNMVVERANRVMPYLVYGAVILLCFISFRSWRAVIVAVIPLLITSVLCEALMVGLGIGVKVATLPVIALGVGIGVDYALYLLSIQLACQRMGDPLHVAYAKALRFTGRIVALVGFTLAIGVSLWAFSPIKFQADMGILLTFMFLWNMVGALVLIPALSHFLLQTKVSRPEHIAA